MTSAGLYFAAISSRSARDTPASRYNARCRPLSRSPPNFESGVPIPAELLRHRADCARHVRRGLQAAWTADARSPPATRAIQARRRRRARESNPDARREPRVIFKRDVRVGCACRRASGIDVRSRPHRCGICGRSSTNVFHLPQSSHLPSHFGAARRIPGRRKRLRRLTHTAVDSAARGRRLPTESCRSSRPSRARRSGRALRADDHASSPGKLPCR